MSPRKPALAIGVYLVVLVLILESKQAQSFSFSGECTYRGYAPAAINKVSSSKAVKPAEFETSLLQQGLAYFNTGSGVTAATLGMIDAVGDVMKAAPQMTAAIGIVTVGLGFMQDEPSAQDILDKAFESVNLLSDEVNLMMDEMKDFVTARDLEIERNLMRNEYKELYLKWASCVKESTVERANSCQRRAVNAMYESVSHFQQLNDKYKQVTYDYRGREKKVYSPFFDYRASAGTWQWMKDECGDRMQCLSHDDVRRLEIGILPFRDYATLHLYALKTLEASLREQPLETSKEACRDYKRYVGEMAERAEEYVDYAKWAKEWDYIRQYEENDFFGVRGRAGGRPAGAFRGGFIGTTKCAGGKCTIECAQVLNANSCTATGGQISDLREALEDKCEAYIGEVKKQLNKFWDENVLETAKQWAEYGKDARAKLESVKCES